MEYSLEEADGTAFASTDYTQVLFSLSLFLIILPMLFLDVEFRLLGYF